jgi:hypothetical protein
VPFERPVTVQDSPLVVQVWLPGEEVTVYSVIILPPLLSGAVQRTVTCPLSALAATLEGAPGAPEMVVELEGFEAGPVPWEFLAVTLKV